MLSININYQLRVEDVAVHVVFEPFRSLLGSWCQWSMASCQLDRQRLRGLEVSVVSRGCSAAVLGKAARWMETMQCLGGRPNVAPQLD